MFKINTESFNYRVEVDWFDANGKRSKQAFIAIFRRMPLREFIKRTGEFQNMAGGDDDDVDINRLGDIVDFLDDVLIGQKQVEIEGMNDEEIREFLINDTTISTAIFRAYQTAVSGDMREKN